MIHDELRAFLPDYAAGRLDDARAAVVRGHLVECRECLRAMFEAPRPRVPVVVVHDPVRWAIAPTARRPPARPRVLAPILVGIAIAVLTGMLLSDLREEAGVQAREAARLALRHRLDEHDREALARVLEETRQQRDAARLAASERAQLRQDLDAAGERIAALTRGLQLRETEIHRLETTADGALRDLLASPGLRLLPLDPVPPFRDPRGHALWHPGRDTMMVFASGLVPGRRYRVEVLGDDGRLGVAQAMPPGPRGDTAVPLRLREPAARLRGLEVILDPPGTPVLAGRRRSDEG